MTRLDQPTHALAGKSSLPKEPKSCSLLPLLPCTDLVRTLPSDPDRMLDLLYAKAGKEYGFQIGRMTREQAALGLGSVLFTERCRPPSERRCWRPWRASPAPR